MSVFGLELPALPEGWTPIEAAVVVKALDTNGVVRACMRYTPGLNTWEGLGMHEAALVGLRHDLNEGWKPSGED